MNQAAYDAIQNAWTITVKARALCPYLGDTAVGKSGYMSADWYLDRGAVYFVNLATPVTLGDVKELRKIASFINRSFVISMAASLEEHGVVPYRGTPDSSKAGGKHAVLTKRLRNHFAHGEWEMDVAKPKHLRTRRLLEELFPSGAAEGPGFVISINTVLDPLKEGVLEYIYAAT